MARVVVLNGTSSSGKTSIARAFQDAAPGRFLNISIDTILYALPPAVVARMQRGEERAGPELVRAFYACVKTLAALGHDLIIDHAVTTRMEAELLHDAVRGHDVLVVALDCPVDVLNERERQRGDRRMGMAEAQQEQVHRWLPYDLRVDTSAAGPEEAARRIIERMRSEA